MVVGGEGQGLVSECEGSLLFAHSPFCRRFHSSITPNAKWVKERSHEAYAKNYSMVFPHDEPLASRNMRCDPFHEVRPPPQSPLGGRVGPGRGGARAGWGPGGVLLDWAGVRAGDCSV